MSPHASLCRSKAITRGLACLLALAAASACGVEPSSDESSLGAVALPGCGDQPDAAVDAPERANLWVFPTRAQFVASFGGRAAADLRCLQAYNVEHMGRECAPEHVHAILNVDRLDTINAMAARFGIPTTAQVRRAADEVLVAASWNELVNPNAALLSPVSPSGSQIFWSGRGVLQDLTCNGWTSSSSASLGIVGDTGRTNAWLTQAAMRCDTQRALACVCWK